MPVWARSVFRAFVLVLLAYLAIAWALQSDAGMWGWGAILLALAGWLGFRLWSFLRVRAARAQLRWERAIYDDGQRPGAIREARRSVAKLSRSKPLRLDELVRTSLSLAELLDADEQYEEAVRVADAIPDAELPRLDAGLVRHTRAVVHLRADDAEGALQAVLGRPSSGDRELDQRLMLLEAYARAERDDARTALSQIERIEQDETADPSVTTEARVVMAAALDVLGRREEAMVVLSSVGRAALEPLSQLGLPRVRNMAREILRAASSRPPLAPDSFS